MKNKEEKQLSRKEGSVKKDFIILIDFRGLNVILSVRSSYCRGNWSSIKIVNHTR